MLLRFEVSKSSMKSSNPGKMVGRGGGILDELRFEVFKNSKLTCTLPPSPSPTSFSILGVLGVLL